MQTLEKRSRHPRVETGGTFGLAALTFFNSATFAYLALALLVLKVLWGAWDVKDLSGGDSIQYYGDACVTFDRGRVNIAWTPLFQVFGATLMHVSHDPYFYCLATRITLVLAISLITLATMRRILPGPIAWFVAAWWALLPINFDTLYDVHLFGAIPILLSWLVLASNKHSRWHRAGALGIIVISSLLVRNEHIVYAMLFGATALIYEIACLLHGNASRNSNLDSNGLFLQHQMTALSRTERITTSRRESTRNVLTPYLVTLTVAALLFVGFYVRSYSRFPETMGRLKSKESISVGQPFAFSYQQRHPDLFKENCWLHYRELMMRQFGDPDPSFAEAVMHNHDAMIEHFAWNASLIPAGLQLALFNEISDGPTPDYINVPNDPVSATVLSALAVAFILLAMIKCATEKDFTRRWLSDNRWLLIAVACYLPLALLVMITHRPRTSYIFPLQITVMGLIGFAIWRLYASEKYSRLAERLSPLCILLVLTFVAPHYLQKSEEKGRPILETCTFLRPFMLVLGADKGNVLVPVFSQELPRYLFDASSGPASKRFFECQNIREFDAPNADVLKVLERRKFSFVLVDYITRKGAKEHPPYIRRALDSSKEWKKIGLQCMPVRSLILYTRSQFYDSK